jgi:protein SHQ1
MPITPKFNVSQNDEFVIVRINVPYVKTSSTELLTEGCDFTFYCRPYLLKIRLPFRVIDDDRCKATVDLDDENGTITAYLPKEIAGQYFPELGLSTKLMSLRVADDLRITKGCNIPSIEVLGYDISDPATMDGGELESESQLRISGSNTSELSLSQKHCYGFNMRYSSILGSLREVFFDMIELPDPDNTPVMFRRELRLAAENSLFDGERYLGDLYGAEDDYLYIEALRFSPHWNRQWDAWSSTLKADATFDAIGGFSADEVECMVKKLPKREYILSAVEKKSVLFVLADVLYSYAFDHRLSQGECNVESAHNITRMSVALSWLEQYNTSGDDESLVVQFSMRRAMIYPYIRHWKLASKVLGDVAKIYLLGKRCVLRCVLHIRNVFEASETHYILNKLFIDDYCTWIQQEDSATFETFGKVYNAAKSDLDKALIGLPVLELENAALRDLENIADSEDSGDDDEGDNEGKNDDNGSGDMDGYNDGVFEHIEETDGVSDKESFEYSDIDGCTFGDNSSRDQGLLPSDQISSLFNELD